MKPNISEFSYGYAITDELIHSHDLPITAAPVFPSLYQEGQVGGGYDVMLQMGRVPLFLQFKLCDCMTRNNAVEVQNGHFNCPFYRMHLRPGRHSRQHELLIDLEQRGNQVYYVAPAFHQPDELNSAYLMHEVADRSIWIAPSSIGHLPDNGNHHVAFELYGDAYRYSEPEEVGEDTSFEAMLARLQDALSREASVSLSREWAEDLALQMRNTLILEGGEQRTLLNDSSEQIGERHPLDQLATYAWRVFDCQLYLVREQS